MAVIRPPRHLQTAGKALWTALARQYSIADEGGKALLLAACEASDRAASARHRIEADGEYLADRFGQLRAHPGVAVERDARAQMLQALRALNLDVEPLQKGVGRPATGFVGISDAD